VKRQARRKLPEGPEPFYVTEARGFLKKSKARVTKARAAVTREENAIKQIEAHRERTRAEGKSTDWWDRQLQAREGELPRLKEHLELAEEVLEGHQANLEAMLDLWVAEGPVKVATKVVAPVVDRAALAKLRQESYPRHMSAREAQEWLDARWGGLTEHGRERVFTVAHLPDDAAEAIGRGWTTMAQEYPRTAERIQFIGDHRSLDPLARAAMKADDPRDIFFPKMGDRAVADAWDHGPARWIRHNSGYYGTPRDFADIQKRRATWVAGNGSHHPIGTASMDGTTHHEFGHHLHYQAKKNSTRQFGRGFASVNDEIDEILERAMTDAGIGLRGATKSQLAAAREKFVARHVSKYATAGTMKHGELVAEIVSFRHGTRWEESPDWVKAIYRVIREAAEGA
jgi:hypothetical protein